MRAATSSTESTSSAISMRLLLAKALISTGTCDALGLFEQQRRAAALHARSANSVISSTGSTSNGNALQLAVLLRARG